MSADPVVAPAGYPTELVSDVVLRDGSTIRLRPVRREDAAAVHDFVHELSQDAIWFRFFGAVNLKWVENYAVDVDYADRLALVAESGSPARIVAHGGYVRTGAETAEVAFVVADRWQGRGIATIMLAHLAAAARARDITMFTAEVLASNHRMIEVFAESGFVMSRQSAQDTLTVQLPTDLTDAVLERFRERERGAAAAAVTHVLEPSSIAVIGASRHRRTIGGELLHNLLSAGFTGPVYAVNPSARRVQGLVAHRDVGSIGSPVDLAIVAVPAAAVVRVARDCAAAGVRALVVISAGFAEVGRDGQARQRELLEVCRRSGMRLVGPNCLGVLNSAPEVRLNATFAPHPAPPGRIGFLSQSGGVGIAMMEAAARLGLGLSSFISVGNKADLSGNDLLEYWEQDPGTDLVLLYLESFGNPRRFARVARRVAGGKPVLAVKSGRTTAGIRGAGSHTGALLAASDVTVDSLFAQTGVIRADTLHELFDVARLLVAQPLPRGERVAIVTNGGGPGILCADACQAADADVPVLPDAVQSSLRAAVPRAASVLNPVDLVAGASAADYAAAARILIESACCDAIIALFVPPLVTQARDVAAALAEVAAEDPGIPIAAVFMDEGPAPRALRRPDAEVPVFQFPEEAARAVALAARYGRWRRTPRGTIVAPAGRRVRDAAEIVSRALDAGAGWMAPDEAQELLACHGLPVLAGRVVAGPDEAATAAAEMGGPVALKAVAPGLVHKSDSGAVALGLHGTRRVRLAAREMTSRLRALGHPPEGLLVQPMAEQGVEMIVGVVHDPSFGPILACGAGGTQAELLRDVAVRITPVTDAEISEMVRSLRTFPLLDGYRKAPPCDVAGLEDVLARVAAMVENHPEIAELDLNPVIVAPGSTAIVDARIRLHRAPAVPPLPSLVN